MGTYIWQTFNKDFIGDGTTPLVQNSLKLYTIPVGSAIRRTTFKIQMSCQIISSSATGLPLDWSPRVRWATALWLGNTAVAPSPPPEPITNANADDWLFWEALQSRVDTDDIANNGIYRVTWETPPEGIDIQTRRNAVAAN